MKGRAGEAVAVVLAHPRHVVLFSIVAGLLLGPVSRAGPAVAAVVVAGLVGLSSATTPRANLLVGLASATTPRANLLVGLASAATPRANLLAGSARPWLGPLAGFALLGGAVVAEARLDATASHRLVALTGRAVEVTATVLEPVRERAAGPAVARVRVSRGAEAGDYSRASGVALAGEVAVMRVRPSAYGGGWPGVGEVVELAGTVAPLGRYDAYQRPRGAGAAIDATALRRTGRRRGGILGALDAVRRRAERGLEHGLRGSEADLLRGMVLGQDERLDEDVRDDFQRSGLAHLLAVSGQNVMLLAILVLAVAGAAGVPLRGRLLLALLLVAAYVPLAGGGPSIQRAGVMGAAGLVAALAGRPASRWYAVGLAAAATLALNPRAASEPGWQLSFAAVVAMLVLCPPLRALLARGLPEPVAEAAAITVAATLGTAPLLALHFEQVSLASLPANLLAAPAVAPIMWLGMLAGAAAQVSPVLATPLNALDGPLLAYLAWLAHAAGAVPLAVVPLRLGPAPAVALGCAAPLAAAAAARALLRRLPPAAASRALGGRSTAPPWRRAVMAAGVLAAVALALVGVTRLGAPSFEAAPGELVVSFLDIGQGDATLLQRDGTSILVDTGPPGGPIVRRLREAGVERLDALVLTHAQLDHEGAALPVMRAFAPRLLLDGGAGWPTPVRRALPAAVREGGTRIMAARAGQALELSGLRFEVLWPPRPPPGWRPEGDPNDRALVALVRFGTFELLLPADAESNVTAALRLPKVEALKVAHHGSADTGLPALLARLRPTVAAIEVGEDNTYGHPTASTLAALRTVRHVVRTDRDGTVRLHVSGGAMRLEKAG